uniref:LCP family protein n=1 Tax=Candidatus Limnocylindrus sp. TaxID=2802978 RepID=UPI004049E4B3
MNSDDRIPKSSAFAAALFSVLLPGLGQAYQRRWRAALRFATPLFLLAAGFAGIYVADGLAGLLGLLLSPLGLSAAGILNILAALWRAAAATEAWRQGLTRGSGVRATLLSSVALASTLAVGLSIHLLVGGYVSTASALVGGIFSGTEEGDGQGGATPPSWDGTERLNVLLIGVDQRQGETSFNTDTLIVASVDPVKGSVSMFSIPRDTVDVPVPASAQALYGSTYNNKINSYYSSAKANSDTFPNGPAAALREMLSEFYGIRIDYSVMVNFSGFKQIVDTLGGIRITTKNPIVDETYPAGAGHLRRIRMPVGVRTMDGQEALIFARSRHGSSDFGRAERQQQVIAAVRAQTDVEAIAANLPALASTLQDAIKSDFPQGDLPRLLELLGRVDASNLKSIVFAPPVYQTVGADERGYIIVPDVEKIRRAILAAFAAEPTPDEVEEQSVEREAARIWVLNGTGRPGEAGAFAARLIQAGLEATAPSGITPPEIGLLQTRLTVYNGAALRVPVTLALIERLMGIRAVEIDDPSVTVDIQIITGADLSTLNE